MTNFQIKTSIFSNGERFPFLINIDTGIPDYWATLYTITQLRAKGRATGTIDQVLRSILIFKTILFKHNIPEIEFLERFKEGWIFHLYEIEGLVEECKFQFEDIISKQTSNWPQKISVKSLEKFRGIAKKSNLKTVDLDTAANRARYIRDFIIWLVDVQASKLNISNPKLKDLMESKKDFILKIDSRIPKTSNNSSFNEKEGLSEKHVELLLSIVNRNSNTNPWKSDFTKARNNLLIIWLLRFGLRRSELLNLKVSDIDFREETFMILRRADDPDDPRKDQPTVKTKGRKISIPKNIVELTYDYVIHYRAKLPQSKKHEFLFVADKSGSPMSKIAVNKVFEQIRNKNPELPQDFSPHILRHTWNDSFSKIIDSKNISEAEEQKMRNYLMGWSDTSKTAAIYTRRHTREKANNAILEMSNKLFNKGDN